MLFPGGKKDKPVKKPGDGILKFGALILIFYVIGSDYVRNKDKEITPPEPAKIETQKPAEIQPEPAKLEEKYPNIASSEVKIGEGETADCGEEVTIKYSSFSEDGKAIEDNITRSFILGNGDFKEAEFEKNIDGMKKGGMRDIIVKSQLSSENKPVSTGFKIEVIDIKHNIKQTDTKFCIWKADWK